MTYTHVARFKGVKGEYAVSGEGVEPGLGELALILRGEQPGWHWALGGQRIMGRPGTVAYDRQVTRYGNAPDSGTGLMLDETFTAGELTAIQGLRGYGDVRGGADPGLWGETVYGSGQGRVPAMAARNSAATIPVRALAALNANLVVQALAEESPYTAGVLADLCSALEESLRAGARARARARANGSDAAGGPWYEALAAGRLLLSSAAMRRALGDGSGGVQR